MEFGIIFSVSIGMLVFCEIVKRLCRRYLNNNKRKNQSA